MILWLQNLLRLGTGSQWYYITRTEGLQLFYYSACNTSGVPHWFKERGKADTVYCLRVRALLKDIHMDWPNARIWTKEEFDAETKSQIEEECT